MTNLVCKDLVAVLKHHLFDRGTPLRVEAREERDEPSWLVRHRASITLKRRLALRVKQTLMFE